MSLETVLGKEWTISPAGGATGDAYYAQYEEKRLFLKRNSSPFLAVLSAEGIVPKLVWTKRLENGDVVTAQHWLDGRRLTESEMKLDRVAMLLSKIHHSTELLDLFMRMGKKPLEPKTILTHLKRVQKDHMQFDINIDIHKAMKYLSEFLPYVENQPKVVCHCDLNHNNWLLTNNNNLYLIDWENAIIADPAMDIGMVLQAYIPSSDWESWLSLYGVNSNSQLIIRIYWYVVAQSLYFISRHIDRNEINQVAFWKDTLHSVLLKIGSESSEPVLNSK